MARCEPGFRGFVLCSVRRLARIKPAVNLSAASGGRGEPEICDENYGDARKNFSPRKNPSNERAEFAADFCVGEIFRRFLKRAESRALAKFKTDGFKDSGALNAKSIQISALQNGDSSAVKFDEALSPQIRRVFSAEILKYIVSQICAFSRVKSNQNAEAIAASRKFSKFIQKAAK